MISMMAASAALIHLGHEIALLLDADLELADVETGAIDDLTRTAGRLDGNVQGGMHGIPG
jgi:hypothetical protein